MMNGLTVSTYIHQNIIRFNSFLAILDLNMQCDLGLEKRVWFAQKLNHQKS